MRDLGHRSGADFCVEACRSGPLSFNISRSSLLFTFRNHTRNVWGLFGPRTITRQIVSCQLSAKFSEKVSSLSHWGYAHEEGYKLLLWVAGA